MNRSARAVALILVSILALTACAELMGNSVDALMRQGVELYTAQRYDEAIAKFAEVVRLDPNFWNAYLYLARSYIAKRAWGDAVINARRALALAPSSGDVIVALAESLLGAGVDALARRAFPEAIGHFTDYVKLRPSDAQGYLQLGRAFVGSGAYGDALRTIVDGITRTQDAAARAQLVRGLLDGGVQALNAGNTKGAVALLEEYVRHDSGNVSAYLTLGKALWQDGNIANALSAFRRVLELNPNNTEALQFLRR